MASRLSAARRIGRDWVFEPPRTPGAQRKKANQTSLTVDHQRKRREVRFVESPVAGEKAVALDRGMAADEKIRHDPALFATIISRHAAPR